MRFCSSLLAIVLVCLIVVEGRNFYQEDREIERNENVYKKLDRNRFLRSKRSGRSYYNQKAKSFQNNGAGSYLKDILFSVRQIETRLKENTNKRYPDYDDNRRDHCNKCKDSLQELLVLYKAIALQLKYTTPPPPQIIYIPFPVPPTFNQSVYKIPSNVNITSRSLPVDVDDISMDTPKIIENDSDGSRPVSFHPAQPKRPHVISPPFEHGSSQAGIQTPNPQKINKLGACKAAALYCCISKTKMEQENCFNLHNCSKSYKTGFACHPRVIQKILSDLSKL